MAPGKSLQGEKSRLIQYIWKFSKNKNILQARQNIAHKLKEKEKQDD